MLTVVYGVAKHYEALGEIASEAAEACTQEQLTKFEKFLEDFDFNGVSWNRVIRHRKASQEKF